MAGLPAGGKTRNRAAREQALIRAATKLFASRGYESTTTRDIAATAGCAEGLIHRYFKGKGGLLLAIVQSRINREVSDLSHKLQPAPGLEQEILQLVNWELERMWEDREFLNIVIPRALLEPSIGQVIRLGPQQRAKVISKRLRRFPQGRQLTADELEAISHFVGVVGFMFGYMRPMVLRQDRRRARKTALSITGLLLRSVQSQSRENGVPELTSLGRQ